ncbi:hypothetical protein [Ornithinibacillus xuwenensis]|uniref:Transposase n=1 Tax=Ornithinibacillus xuwenensis TaxID=3144668 RepID=A0ABU9XDP1_9BACI
MQSESQKLKETLQSIWEEVKRIFNNVVEALNDLEQKKRTKHEYNWYVPKKITRNSQVILRKPLVFHARANL